MLRATLTRTFNVTIVIERGAIDRVGEIVGELSPYNVLLVSDREVTKIWAQRVRESLDKANVPLKQVLVPAGERSKTLRIVSRLWKYMLKEGYARDSMIVAVGGGSLLDAVGFVASTFMRGCRLVYVPTTLLAQADAAIGGKTAIDFCGKNTIGTFYHPECIIIDPTTIKTLPLEEVKSGLVEVVKHATISGEDFFEFVESNIERLPHDVDLIEEAVKRSVSFKLNIVASDYTDEGGIRALLNFGHTIGHAIEAASNFTIGHGKAVAIGMIYEARIAHELLGFPREQLERLERIVRKLDLPTRTSILPASLLKHLRHDKKFLRGKPRLPLPVRIGEFQLVELKWRGLEEVLSKL